MSEKNAAFFVYAQLIRCFMFLPGRDMFDHSLIFAPLYDFAVMGKMAVAGVLVTGCWALFGKFCNNLTPCSEQLYCFSNPDRLRVVFTTLFFFSRCFLLTSHLICSEFALITSSQCMRFKLAGCRSALSDTFGECRSSMIDERFSFRCTFI
jgi:hypothetical protein